MKNRIMVPVLLLLLSTITLFPFLSPAKAATTVGGIINSNITWTKGDSPYNLIADVIVDNSVTLTIEAGAVVNLNNYHITVNGVLIAKGTINKNIQINGVSGSGPFMPPPAPNPYPFIYGINFTKISAGYDVQTDTGSIIQNAVINSTTLALGSSPKIDNDTINGYVTSNGTSIISNNIITGKIDLTGPSTVSNNKINGAIQVQTNVLGGNLYDSSNSKGTPIISNNNVTGGGINGIGISFLTASSSNIIVSGNTITGCSKAGIAAEGVGLIENNLIKNNQDGIDIEGLNTVANNTIEDNHVGIQQANNFDFPTVLYNNIQNNSYNYFLSQSVANNVNATYNYWGTTNQTAISNSIYDKKNNSDLGSVMFEPFLTQPNPEAMPAFNPQIPEVPFPILLVVAVAVIIVAVVAVAALVYFKKRKH